MTKDISVSLRDKKEDGIKMQKQLCFDLTYFLFKKKNFSKSFQKIVVSCQSLDPALRPTVLELLGNEVTCSVAELSRDNRYDHLSLRAIQAKNGLEKGVVGVKVVVFLEKPRKGCFEIREESGEIFISLLDMKRPLKELDMDKEKSHYQLWGMIVGVRLFSLSWK
ncbi:hypothetical protein BUALT_Bualt01G0219000 [Buddleja alternifolia]|uniref:Uncharacterized protein n=1 Tax=Buddleja alternifolia TaxID=168488 RepID=A0AAV6YDB1_9LAMI|nr:hypothetical protein BUALT_Bualt01G0219000 [Buddleja alternifolia]